MDYVVGMCHAPREVNTLNATLASMSWYTWDIIIRAEPNTKKINKKNIIWHQNKQKLWCFKNHHQLILDFLDREEEYFVMFQDDFQYREDTFDIIDDAIKTHKETWRDFWYYCFHTNEFYRWHIHSTWRNQLKIKFGLAFQVSYLMNKSVIQRMIEHEFYKDHLQNYKLNKQVDACISETFHRMWLPMYYHNPSLSIHIGSEYSTIGHAHRHTNEFTSFT